uniref:SFRICE_040710 n=1 Tax=Spodoptera frugiperda TaxID=7108 RepID=A0A2H1WLF9_SPOFR
MFEVASICKMESGLNYTCITWITVLFVNHIVRRNPENLEKLEFVCQVNGKRPRGRSPICWLDAVQNLTGLTVLQAIKTTEDRVA